MKVILDTNVIISAFLTRGLPGQVIIKCLKDHQVFISPWIIDEVKKVLRKKFSVKKNDLNALLMFIDLEFDKVSPKEPLPKVCQDKNDNNLLMLADFISAKALVTGDKDLLILKKYKKTLILTPRDFYRKYLV